MDDARDAGRLGDGRDDVPEPSHRSAIVRAGCALLVRGDAIRPRRGAYEGESVDASHHATQDTVVFCVSVYSTTAFGPATPHPPHDRIV